MTAALDDRPVVHLAVPLPLATDAEEHLAGCAAATSDGAEVALDHGVSAQDFYDRRCWRAIAASADAPRWDGTVCVCHDLECEHATLERRIAYVSAEAGVDAPELRRWVAERPVLVDSGGGLARRVIAAAEARRRLAVALDAIEQAAA